MKHHTHASFVLGALDLGIVKKGTAVADIASEHKRAHYASTISYPMSRVHGEIPYFIIVTLALVGKSNEMAGIVTDSLGDFLMYWVTLFLFTVCLTYFRHDDFPRTGA